MAYDEMGNYVPDDWFNLEPPSPTAAIDTYVNQTPAREAYYAANPEQAPQFTPEEQTGLDELLGRPPTPTPTPTPTATQDPFASFFPGGTFNGDYQGYFNALFPGDTLTMDQLRAQAAALRRAGMELVTSASGNTGWIRYPGSGGDIDVIGDQGGANRKQWLRPGAGSGASQDTGGFGGGGGGGATNIPPELVAPLLQPFTEPFQFGSFIPPEPFQFRDFQAPEANAIFSDPGFQARLSEGQKAIERASSARGTLNTGGTLKALLGFGQQLGSQEYGNVYGRQASEFDRARNNAFQQYQTNYGQRAAEYNQDYNQALADYERRYNISTANQDRPFNKLTALAGFGQVTSPFANFSSSIPNLYSQGAQAYGDYLTQGANARAAGQVGSANAYGNAFGNIGNQALTGLFLNNYLRPADQPRQYDYSLGRFGAF